MKLKYRHIIDYTALAVGAALIAFLIFNKDKFIALIQNIDLLKGIAEQNLALAALFSFALFFVCLFFVPLALQIAAAINGYIFGLPLGMLITLVSAVATYTTVFFLSEKLGRKLLKHIVSLKELEHLRTYLRKLGMIGVTIAYAIPFFPIETLSYMLGLMNVKYKRFIVYGGIGLVVNIFVLTFLGDKVTKYAEIIGNVLIYVIVALFLIYVFRHFVRKHVLKFFIEEFKKL